MGGDEQEPVTALTPTQLRAVLSEHGLRPTKALGQHFLVDPNTARRIVDRAGITSGARVFEIGPGAGSLTVALAATGASVTALELDRHLLPVLEDVLVRSGVSDRVSVSQGDALTADLDAVLGHRPHDLVANLPYNVSVPIIMRVFEGDAPIRRAVVMVQREVADRLVAVPGTKDFGSVSVRLAYLATARRVGLVPRTVFMPTPKVDSALVELVRRDAPPVDVPSRAALFVLVREGFGQRRKMLRRALRAYLGDRTEAVLVDAGIDPTRRAESLDLADWAALARAAGPE